MLIKKLIKIMDYSSCLICGDAGLEHICQACQQFLHILPQICQQCAQILPASINDVLPAHCQSCQLLSPPFDTTLALYPYTFPIVGFIHRLKFQSQLIYATLFARKLIKLLEQRRADFPLPDLIIPVPLHTTRLKERGYNQAIEIARPIAKHFDIPLLVHQVTRNRATAPQTLLTSAAERQTNVYAAFSVTANLQGKQVAVVDDVVTTGHTMRAFCEVIKQSGAARIDVWCCARAIGSPNKVAQN